MARNPSQEGIVYGAFDIVAAKTEQDALSVFRRPWTTFAPTLEVKPKRVGGTTYQVPMEVNPRRATTLAIRWIVDFSRKRKEHTMAQRLAAENHGCRREHWCFCQKREDLYKMAEVQPCVLALSLVGKGFYYHG